jgi:hypothetical protein
MTSPAVGLKEVAMSFLILLGTTALLALFFLTEGLLHLREVIGPWTLDPHEYDDAWKAAHRA